MRHTGKRKFRKPTPPPPKKKKTYALALQVCQAGEHFRVPKGIVHKCAMAETDETHDKQRILASLLSADQNTGVWVSV